MGEQQNQVIEQSPKVLVCGRFLIACQENTGRSLFAGMSRLAPRQSWLPRNSARSIILPSCV